MSVLASASPWDGSPVATVEGASSAEIVAAAQSAAAAWDRWGAISNAAERRARLLALADAATAQRDIVVDLLVREAGKTLADARAEADLLPRKVAISLQAGLARTPQTMPAARPGALWRPRGVAVCIGPYNFPLHLLHGLVVPALAVGCTVLAKPSERCPGLGAAYATLISAAGLDGVCQIVQGGAAVAAELVSQPQVMSVAAVGSRGMGSSLSTRLGARPEVVLALELGGVNHALVCDDADIAAAARDLAEGAWRMAGQRCTATRIVHVPRALLSRLCDLLLAERANWLPASAPDHAGSGRLINTAARSRFAGAWASRGVGLPMLAGHDALDLSVPTCTQAPLLAVVEDPAVRVHSLYTDEHFGPMLIVDPYDDEGQAVQRMRANPARLAASVFTASADRFAALAAVLPYGQVNYNRPTAGARSDMPFGGCGISGNGRPAALAAGAIFADECVVW